MADAKKPATAIEPWQVLDSKISYHDRWLTVRSDTVRVPNGTILSPYHTIEFPEWVCAIALTPEREIVLIEEYRHGIERLSVELPCGTPDDDSEDVLDAMKRELLEETGYASQEWHLLGSSTANTARQNTPSWRSMHARLPTRSSTRARSSAPTSYRGTSSSPILPTAGWRFPACSLPRCGS
jgi:hypothetical protein